MSILYPAIASVVITLNRWFVSVRVVSTTPCVVLFALTPILVGMVTSHAAHRL